MYKISLIGAPGVGKGTFAKIICETLNLQHISIGQLMRDDKKVNLISVVDIQNHAGSGVLLPDQIALQLIKQNTENSSFKYSGYILDGYPRTISQAKDMMHHDLVTTVIHIKLKKDIAIQKALARRVCRICDTNYNIANIIENGYDMPAILPTATSCVAKDGQCANHLHKRSDDTVETLTRRYDHYEETIAPLVDYLTNLGLLVSFEVKKGIKDSPALLDLIRRFSTSSSNSNNSNNNNNNSGNEVAPNSCNSMHNNIEYNTHLISPKNVVGTQLSEHITNNKSTNKNYDSSTATTTIESVPNGDYHTRSHL